MGDVPLRRHRHQAGRGDRLLLLRRPAAAGQTQPDHHRPGRDVRVERDRAGQPRRPGQHPARRRRRLAAARTPAPARNPTQAVPAQDGESMQQLLSRLNADPAGWRSAMAGLNSPLGLAAGFQVQLAASASVSAGIGVSAGFAAGLSAGARHLGRCRRVGRSRPVGGSGAVGRSGPVGWCRHLGRRRGVSAGARRRRHRVRGRGRRRLRAVGRRRGGGGGGTHAQQAGRPGRRQRARLLRRAGRCRARPRSRSPPAPGSVTAGASATAGARDCLRLGSATASASIATVVPGQRRRPAGGELRLRGAAAAAAAAGRRRAGRCGRPA